MSLPIARIDQICLIVQDLDNALRLLAEKFGIQPFTYMEFGHIDGDPSYDPFLDIRDTYWKGRYIDTYAVLNGSHRFDNGIELEFICPMETSNDNLQLEYLHEHGPGAQHFYMEYLPGTKPDEVYGIMAAAGNPLSSLGVVGGRRKDHGEICSFVDHRGRLGLDIEVKGAIADPVDVRHEPGFPVFETAYSKPLMTAIKGWSFACENLKQALELLQDDYGIGQWTVEENASLIRATSICFGAELELIQPKSRESAEAAQVRNYLDRYGIGIYKVDFDCPIGINETEKILCENGLNISKCGNASLLINLLDEFGVYFEMRN